MRIPEWRPVLLALLLAAPGVALGALDLERLARIVEAGHFERAYALAREHRFEHEGDPVFDLYYGIAAVATGHYGEGVFALRRVLALRPELDRARLALARAHFAMGNDLDARREFRRVLANDPPAPVRADIERYLAALDRRASRYRTTLSGYLELGGGHDTNVNSANEVDSIDTVSGPIVIEESGQEQADDFARVAGGLRIEHPLVPDLGLFASIDAERRFHDEFDPFALGGVLLRSGLVASGERSRTTLGAHGQRLYLDGDSYRDTGGLDADWRYARSDHHVIELSGRWSQLDYETATERDSELWQLTAGTTALWQRPLRPVLSVSISWGEEEARRDTVAARVRATRDLYGVSGELRLRLAPRWRLSADLGYRRSDYEETDPRFATVREDDYYRTGLMLEWRARQSLRLQLRLTHSVNDSNQPLFEYDRSVAGLRLRYDFDR
ncbi:MAG: surface lipoprotein assembly modifier [Gammaproteobacteria bacterium]|nr:surface lipoprotein assembly modifier [Gammaproteobacteria bacterium]